MHPCCHVGSELQQLLGGEGGSGAVLLGKDGIGLQHPTFPQEVEKVTVGRVFNGYVQVAWKTPGETQGHLKEEGLSPYNIMGSRGL